MAWLDKPEATGQNMRPWAHGAQFEQDRRASPQHMANHKQAEKRNRQRIKRRARNLMHLSTMRTYMKRVRKAIAEGDLETARTTLPVALEAIGKANSKGVIHRHTASRYASRLTVAVAKATT
jgi:small subunit ribosomal protein S20